MIALDARSETNLLGVHRDLVEVVRGAADLSSLAFVVTEGLRTKDRQAQLVKAGASRTMQSRHLTGHAVDLAPRVDGVVRFDWPLFYYLASIMRVAARDADVLIVWGGVWDRTLNELTGEPEAEVHEYAKRWREANPQAAAAGWGPLSDGPHFELELVHYRI